EPAHYVTGVTSPSQDHCFPITGTVASPAAVQFTNLGSLSSNQGAMMAKRKKQSKALKRKAMTGRSKARKASKAAKRTVAKAKRKGAPVKKAARKVKQPFAPFPW